MSTYIVASLPLPLYCGILLLAKQHETKLASVCYSGITVHSPLQGDFNAALQAIHCGNIADLICSGILATPIIMIVLLIIEQLRLRCRHFIYSGILATPILLWDYAAMKAV